MKSLIKRWLGIVDKPEQEIINIFKVDHPDFLEAQINSEMRKAYNSFFRGSMAGRVLIANLYQDIQDLMQEASATPDHQLRNYLISKAGGQREQLAKILKLCVIKEPKPIGDDSMPKDALSAALGHDYEIGEER